MKESMRKGDALQEFLSSMTPEQVRGIAPEFDERVESARDILLAWCEVLASGGGSKERAAEVKAGVLALFDVDNQPE